MLTKRVFAVIAALCLIAALILSGTSCTPVVDNTVASVSIKEGSFSAEYDVDEELSLVGAELIAKTVGGNYSAVTITADMVEGFDTTTTGEKSLRIKYQNIYSENWVYKVVYASDPTKQVTTTARVGLVQDTYPTGIKRLVELRLGDMKEVDALLFTITASKDFADAQFSRLELQPLAFGWAYSLHYTSARQVRVIVYTTVSVGLTDDGNLLNINIIGVEGLTIALTDVLISDGVADYVLPPTKEV